MSENLPVCVTNDTPKEVAASFGSTSGFDLLQRQARLLSSSSLLPETYSIFGKGGQLKPANEQAYAVANAVIVLEMAARLNASPLMVAQNLYVVHGRPSWSSQFIIAAINASGKFSPLRFATTDPEPEKEISCTVVEWRGGQKTTKVVKEKVRNRVCTAWAIERETGERLESPPVSLEMAIEEGWATKDGSKWKTMPDLMLRYRAATLFGRLYVPDLLMGLQTEDEGRDVVVDAVLVPPASAAPANRPQMKAKAVVIPEAVVVAPASPTPMSEEEDVPMFAEDAKPPRIAEDACVACNGSGRNSKGAPCRPCGGAGKKAAKRLCPNRDGAEILDSYCDTDCKTRTDCPAWA